MKHIDHPIQETEGFDWDARMQGLVLSSFSFGYVTTQLIGGILAERFGGKWIFGVCILVCSVLEFVIPLAAKFNIFALMAVRAIQECMTKLRESHLLTVWPQVAISRNLPHIS